MSQSNVDFSNDMSGTELLDEYLTPLQENVYTSSSGVQRPSYARKGTKWLDTSSTPAVYKMFDGDKDIIIGKVGDTFQPATPLTTAGDILVQGADGNLNKLPAGAVGTVLTANGTGALPSYQINPIGVLTYSSSYTYKKNDIVISASDDETALYKSLIDSNIGNDLSDDSKWEKISFGSGGGVGDIGDINYTARTEVPNGGAWCDGAEYTQAQFPDIYQMLVDNKLQKTTFEDFNSKVSANGYCELFALDTSAQKFKVPSLPDKYVIDTNATAPVKGNGIALGMTNGSINVGAGARADLGCFYIARPGLYGKNIGTTSSEGTKVIPDGQAIGVTTDASKSGIIADTSDLSKVVTLKAYVVLYASAVEASVAQAQEFMTALGNKANADLSNVSSNVDYVVESQVNEDGSFYRIYKSGLIEQGGLVSNASNATVTLLKAYKDTNYILLAQSNSIDVVSFNDGAVFCNNKTTTNFKVTANKATLASWYAIGQGAE